MAEIVVVGAGVTGSAAALMLAGDGHSVTLLDRDSGPVPSTADEAWRSWNRSGVGQFRMAHLMLARGTSIMRDELPQVAARLERAGGLRMNGVDVFLDHGGVGEREPADDRFNMLTARRTTIDWSFATAVDADPSISVRRGSVVEGLLSGPQIVSGTPHVTGVRLEDGEEISADLVVDATGRRSPNMRWIAELGGTQPTELSEDSGFAYYGRFFKSADGSVPDQLTPVLTPFGSMSVLAISSDNGTWAVMLYASSKDKALRRFRDPEVFESVVRACPLLAHWMDGEPISEIASMVGVADRTRSFVVDGQPVVTGMVSIGDAWACTNPSVGRGMSLGLLHTVLMRDVVRDHLDDPQMIASEFGRRTESEAHPWHEATRQLDRARVSEMRALAEGREPEANPQNQISAALAAAAKVDLTVARALSEIVGCITPVGEVLSRDGLLEHVIEVAATSDGPAVGPDRAKLLELVG